MTDTLSAVSLGLSSAGPALPPTPAEAAQAELESLKANGDWVKRHLSGDQNTKADVQRLTEAMHRTPAGSIAVGGPTLEAQRNDQADWLAENGPGLSAAVIEQVRKGIPEAPETYAEAQRLKKSLLADPAFRQRYMNNDHEARRKLTLIDVILSGPISHG